MLELGTELGGLKDSEAAAAAAAMPGKVPAVVLPLGRGRHRLSRTESTSAAAAAAANASPACPPDDRRVPPPPPLLLLLLEREWT
jgi:hypothetical protein